VPFLILILCIAALVLLVSYICARMVFAGDKSDPDDIHLPRGRQYLEIKDRIFALIDESAALPYEDIWHSNDGLRLHARLYYAGENAPVHILMHGYRSNALLDFSGAIRDGVNKGHNIILVDQRATAEVRANISPSASMKAVTALHGLSMQMNASALTAPLFSRVYQWAPPRL